MQRGGEVGPEMVGAGNDVNASNGISACVDYIAGNVGGVGSLSDRLVGRDRSWANVGRHGWSTARGITGTLRAQVARGLGHEAGAVWETCTLSDLRPNSRDIVYDYVYQRPKWTPTGKINN